MTNILKQKIWPVVVGLLLAFATMMLFEVVNSFFFPFPEGMDVRDVKDFTDSLPWTVYILVLIGWMVGSFLAGYATTKLTKEQSYHLSFVVGVILTLFGVINNMLIGHDMVFNVIGLPTFIIFTYFGHKYRRRTVRQELNSVKLS